MPKSKNRKNHKKKVAARRKKMQEDKNRYMKMQKEALMQLIAQEQKNGQFEAPGIPNIEGPTDGPSFDGPSI